MKKTLSLLIAIVLLSSSCKKDSETKVETKTDILSKGAWTIESYGVDTNMDLVLTGSENETQTCNADNTYSFSANGSLVLNSGTIKCGSEATTQTGTWQFYLNETKLDLFGNTYMIKTLTNTRLELYNPGPASNAMLIFKR
ncbi:MAG: hypothetical protein ABL872_18490 [Lacibacter sp.]